MTMSQRVRQISAGVLVVVFGVSFLASGLGIWLHRSTLNEDVWAERIGTLGEDPEVQSALARYTTDQILGAVNTEELLLERLPERTAILAIPFSVAVEGFVADRVDRFFASDRFEELWATAATRAQEEAVALLRDEKEAIGAESDKVVINLLPMIDAVLREIATSVPDLLGLDVELPVVSLEEVPERARERLAEALGIELEEGFGTIVIYERGTLAAAQRAVQLFDRGVVVAIVVALASGLGALWASPRGRRTAFQLLGAAAVGAVVARRAALILEREVLDLVRVEENRGAVQVVLTSVVQPLAVAAGSVLWALAFLALLLAITGPYGWARALRGQSRGAATSLSSSVVAAATGPQVASFARQHADALRVGGWALGAAVLWFADLSWFTLALAALLVVGWQVVLGRLVAAPESAPPPAEAVS